MTFTVIARDSTSGQLGIGIATYSLAVGASCPHIRPEVGAVSTQAATYPAHGPALLDLLEQGIALQDAFAHLSDTDESFEFRQIGVVTADGSSYVHTGNATRSWAGSLIGDGWLVMGNVLAGEHVANAIRSAFDARAVQPLSEKIVTALEAGRDAGGQLGLEGKRLPERSAIVTVYGDEPFAEIDLRVDDHHDAVTELRRIFDRFIQADGYYRDRAERPGLTPPQDQWMTEHGME